MEDGREFSRPEIKTYERAELSMPVGYTRDITGLGAD